jgi:chaperone modulatory protein CbpM
MSTTALARPIVLSLEAFAALTQLHPDHLRRLVTLGVLDATPSAKGELVFQPEQLAVLAQIERLRVGLGLDYVAAGLVCHLLGRIDALERQLRFNMFM